MKNLSFADVGGSKFKTGYVDAKEFANDESENVRILVRELTIGERREIMREAVENPADGKGNVIFPYARIAFYCALEGDQDPERITADDPGKRLFPNLEYVEGIAGSRRDAVLRIAAEVLKVSGITNAAQGSKKK